MSRPELIVVEWLDACHSKDEPEGFGMKCRNVGYVVERSEEGLRIASEWGPDDDTFRFYLDIPAGMIRWEAPLQCPESPPNG